MVQSTFTLSHQLVFYIMVAASARYQRLAAAQLIFMAMGRL